MPPNNSSVTGMATAPSTARPPRTNPTHTAKVSRPAANSRVPSSGSTSQILLAQLLHDAGFDFFLRHHGDVGHRLTQPFDDDRLRHAVGLRHGGLVTFALHREACGAHCHDGVAGGAGESGSQFQEVLVGHAGLDSAAETRAPHLAAGGAAAARCYLRKDDERPPSTRSSHTPCSTSPSPKPALPEGGALVLLLAEEDLGGG